MLTSAAVACDQMATATEALLLYWGTISTQSTDFVDNTQSKVSASNLNENEAFCNAGEQGLNAESVRATT